MMTTIYLQGILAMGFMFTLAFFTVIFVVGLAFAIPSLLLVLYWRRKKRRGERPRVWWFVLSIVTLIISTLVALAPLYLVLFVALFSMAYTAA